MKVIQYTQEYSDKWDEFVLNKTINGTFLQTRKFLSYHPEDRFEDFSLLIEDKGKIVAVCPACVEERNGEKVFISHKGSTYGGLIMTSQIYKTEKVLGIISAVESYLQVCGFKKVVYRITPDIFCSIPSDLLNFCLNYAGYSEKQTLNFYIDYMYYKCEILQNFDRGKRRNIENCLKAGLYEKQISTNEELEEFHQMLCESLKKYDTVPVHSFNELCLLRDMFEKEIFFMGIYLNGKMVAGGMLFYFEQTKCMHAQYFAADRALNKISPMTFLYYSAIKDAKKRGCRYLSWGIATDHEGNLNKGLIQAKEAVGSRHEINRTFEKKLDE